jgi:hypothetical protein
MSNNLTHIRTLEEQLLQELSAKNANIKFGVEIEMLAPEDYGTMPYEILYYMRTENKELKRLLKNWKAEEDASIRSEIPVKLKNQDNKMRKKINSLWDKYPRTELMKQWDSYKQKTFQLSKYISADTITDMMMNAIMEDENNRIAYYYFEENKWKELLQELENEFKEKNVKSGWQALSHWFHTTANNLIDETTSFDDLYTRYVGQPDYIIKDFCRHLWASLISTARTDYMIRAKRNVNLGYFRERFDAINNEEIKQIISSTSISQDVEQICNWIDKAKKNVAIDKAKREKRISNEEYKIRKKYKNTIDKITEYNKMAPVEFVSPAYYYNTKNVNDVKKILATLNKNGFMVNGSTGLHIHISTTQKFTNFNLLALALWVKDHEREFYLMFGDIRKDNDFCKSIVEGFENIIENRLEEIRSYLYHILVKMPSLPAQKEKPESWKHALDKNTEELVTMWRNIMMTHQTWMAGQEEDRQHGLNLEALEKHGTIEFRYGAGTFNQTLFYQYLLLCIEAFYNIFVQEIKYQDMIIKEVTPELTYEFYIGTKQLEVEI